MALHCIYATVSPINATPDTSLPITHFFNLCTIVALLPRTHVSNSTLLDALQWTPSDMLTQVGIQIPKSWVCIPVNVLIDSPRPTRYGKFLLGYVAGCFFKLCVASLASSLASPALRAKNKYIPYEVPRNHAVR